VNRAVFALCGMTMLAWSVAAQSSLPQSRLAIRESGAQRVFWESGTAPSVWTTAPLASRVRWRSAAKGVETSELQIAGTGEAWRTRLVLARLDTKLLTLSLDTASDARGRPAWNVARAPDDAAFAMNAGQFRSTFPWGRVILDGHQMLPPERGPLAMTFAIDSTGALHWVHDGEPMPRGVAWAFQSYPVVLRSHAVPAALQGSGRAIDVRHRDARLAIGTLPGGALLVALTRFDALGGVFNAVPFGLTVPEMAAVMGALGASDAVLLDGGISAQLVAGIGEKRVAMEGWRDVPLAFIARSRPDTAR
jgi:hypothetical protein